MRQVKEFHYLASTSDPSRALRRIAVVIRTVGELRRSVLRVVAAEPQDAVLLARIQAGDDRALAAIYDLHSPLVFGLARRVTRDEQLARDITQDVLHTCGNCPDGSTSRAVHCVPIWRS